MFVTLTVQISDTQYTYQGTSGEAELKMELPMPVVHFVEPSKMFIGLLEAAIQNFQTALDEKEKERLVAMNQAAGEEKDGIH